MRGCATAVAIRSPSAGKADRLVEVAHHREPPPERAAGALARALAGEEVTDPRARRLPRPRNSPPGTSIAWRRRCRAAASSAARRSAAWSGDAATTAARTGPAAESPASVAARSPSSAKARRLHVRPGWPRGRAGPRYSRRLAAAARCPAGSATSRIVRESRLVRRIAPSLCAARTTCALIPPNPMDETPARMGCVLRPQLRGQRHPQCRSVPGQHRMRIGMAGGRRDDLVVHGHGGLDQPGDARGCLGVSDVALDVLIAAVGPRGPGGAAGLAEGPQLGGVADRGPGAVSLQVPDGGDVESGELIGPAERQPVPGRLRPRDAALAVGGVTPPGDRRVDPQSRALPRRPAASARACRSPPPARSRWSAGRRPASRSVASAPVLANPMISNGSMLRSTPPATAASAASSLSAAHAVDHRQQRRRAGAVDGEPAALEVEVVADPAGDRVGQAAGQRVLVDRRERALVPRLRDRPGSRPACRRPSRARVSAALSVRRT